MRMLMAMAVVAVAGSLVACAGPQTSRSGEIHTVNIEREPMPPIWSSAWATRSGG